MIMDFKGSSVPPLYTDLARTLGGEIDTSYRNIEEHSEDCSPCKIAPHIITYPKTIDDIKKILARADEYRIPVAVRGYGRNASGAALVEGIVINMTKYFNHIKHVDMLGHTISVDPGVSCKKIREHLESWGMEIPFLTEQDDENTIGGVVATKNVSPTSFESGPISSWVIGLSIVLSNGEQHTLEDGITPSGKLLSIYQSLFPLLAKEVHNLRGGKPMCAEDNGGYNIWGQSIGPRQLINNIIGSQGTLAIITGIKLRIVPKSPHKKTMLIRVPSYADLPHCVQTCKEHGVDSMHMYDLMLEKLYEEYSGFGKEGAASQLPHTLTIVATHSGGDEKALHEKQKRLADALKLAEGYVEYVSSANHFYILTEHTHIQKLLSAYNKGALVPVLTGNGMIVPIEHLGGALLDIEDYHNENHLLFCVTGNVGSGHISITTLLSPEPATYADKVMEATKACFLVAKKYKGGASAASGDGMIGTLFLDLFYSPKILEIFSAVKQVWDPHDILNPGKKKHFDASYVKQRIYVKKS
jgi:FAD/FMN-containing dehydrogenase